MQECHEGLSKSRMSIRQLVLCFSGNGSEDSLLRCPLVVLVRRIPENVLDRSRLPRVGEVFDHDLLDQIVDEGVEGSLVVVVVADVLFAHKVLLPLMACVVSNSSNLETSGWNFAFRSSLRSFRNLWAHQIWEAADICSSPILAAKRGLAQLGHLSMYAMCRIIDPHVLMSLMVSPDWLLLGSLSKMLGLESWMLHFGGFSKPLGP